MLRCLGLYALLLVALCLRALRPPFVPGFGSRQPLLLPCETCWFCGTMRLKEGSFGIGSGATAIGKIVVFGLSHSVFR